MDGTRDVGATRHRHMGVATADPQYLPAAASARARRRETGEKAPRQAQPGTKRKVIHSDRYLQVPKAGKAIFTSREERARRRVRSLLIVLIIAAIILVLAWRFLLR